MFLVASLLIGGSCGDRSLGRRTNVAKRSENNTCNNIYTKINTLEKDLSNLETKLRKRTELLQQVLRSVLEMDSNLEMSEENQKKQTNLASKRNGNIFRKVNSDIFIFILIREVPNLATCKIILFFLKFKHFKELTRFEFIVCISLVIFPVLVYDNILCTLVKIYIVNHRFL